MSGVRLLMKGSQEGGGIEMGYRHDYTGNSASRTIASLFGVLAGLGGIRHSTGEMLQGDVAPGGLVIDSWAQGPIATNMGASRR